MFDYQKQDLLLNRNITVNNNTPLTINDINVRKPQELFYTIAKTLIKNGTIPSIMINDILIDGVKCDENNHFYDQINIAPLLCEIFNKHFIFAFLVYLYENDDMLQNFTNRLTRILDANDNANGQILEEFVGLSDKTYYYKNVSSNVNINASTEYQDVLEYIKDNWIADNNMILSNLFDMGKYVEPYKKYTIFKEYATIVGENINKYSNVCQYDSVFKYMN